MFRIAELVARRLVNGHGPATRGRVGLLAGMELAGGKTELAFAGHEKYGS
jgi:hypothetical protein